MTRSTCWNKAERPQKKTTHIVQPGLANRTEALVSLYWSSWSLHPKEPPNRISHKSTKTDPIRSSETWKMSYQISKSYALQHIKIFFTKNARSMNAHDWGYKWSRHTQGNPLNNDPILTLHIFPAILKNWQGWKLPTIMWSRL